MPLLDSIQNGTVPFVWKNPDGKPIVAGERFLYFEDQEWNEVKAAYLAFNGRTATAQEILEQRDRLRWMTCKRIASWDGEYMHAETDKDGNPILDKAKKPILTRKPVLLTVEGLTVANIKDDFLSELIDFLNSEPRVPNSANES